MKQPMQPIFIDDLGTARFQQNAICKYLVDAGLANLNHLAVKRFTDEDRMQFAQLIGYSVSGFGELNYADKKTIIKSDKIVKKLLENKNV